MLKELALTLLAITPACALDNEDVSVTQAALSKNSDDTFGARIEHGKVQVTSIPQDGGAFFAHIEVHLVRAAANATYTLQRAPEIGRPFSDDGICQRANAQYPWAQPDSDPFPTVAQYLTFEPPSGPVTIKTNAGGNGKVEFDFGPASAFTSGTHFDVQFRALGPTSIESECFTVTVR
jgi:hypothetical protein